MPIAATSCWHLSPGQLLAQGSRGGVASRLELANGPIQRLGMQVRSLLIGQCTMTSAFARRSSVMSFLQSVTLPHLAATRTKPRRRAAKHPPPSQFGHVLVATVNSSPNSVSIRLQPRAAALPFRLGRYAANQAKGAASAGRYRESRCSEEI